MNVILRNKKYFFIFLLIGTIVYFPIFLTVLFGMICLTLSTTLRFINSISLLPPYSPDLNPIEMAFSKLKALPRKFAERTADALWGRLAELINAFSPRECANYIKDAGYGHSI
jgi:hypothetical protein